MEPSGSEVLVRAVRRLTTAVWVLVALVAIIVSLNLISYVPWLFEMIDSRSSPSNAQSPRAPSAERFENLHEMPVEQLVKAASVIAISTHTLDAGKGKCVLAEILKQDPGVRFYYKIGDNFRHCSFDPADGSMHGEGQVMFFTGNPASFSYSTTYFGGRVSGLGDMPLEDLRKLIVSQTNAPR